MKKYHIIFLTVIFFHISLTAEINLEIYPFMNISNFKNKDLSNDMALIFCDQLRKEERYNVVFRNKAGIDETRDTSVSNQPFSFKLAGTIEKCSLSSYGVVTPGWGGFSHYTSSVNIRIEVYSNGKRTVTASGEALVKDNQVGLTIFGGPGTSMEFESLVFKELQGRSLYDKELKNSIVGRALYGSIDDAVKKIKARFPVGKESTVGTEGFFEILDKEGDTVYINAGLLDSVKPGDLFNVYKLGQKITEPGTGKTLGFKEDYIGRVRVILVLSDSLSKARIIDGKDRITKKSRVRK